MTGSTNSGFSSFRNSFIYSCRSSNEGGRRELPFLTLLCPHYLWAVGSSRKQLPCLAEYPGVPLPHGAFLPLLVLPLFSGFSYVTGVIPATSIECGTSVLGSVDTAGRD